MSTVIFDFDGTLTEKSINIWRGIWQELGYNTAEGSYYRQIYSDFMNKKINHGQWCELTCDAFKLKGLTKQHLLDVASRVKLKPSARQTILDLKQRGCELHVLSGNIKPVIMFVLGDLVDCFETINANDFVFDTFGNFQDIIGTKYDFEGKATFVKELCKTQNKNPKDVYFVGNGSNDLWVHESGCVTICTSPDEDVDETNKTIWQERLQDLSGLSDIL